MKKNTFKLLTIGISVALLSSCTSYQHTYRLSEVADKNLKQADQYVVDVRYDLNKMITGESGKHKSPSSAREEAYYNAIKNNNVHILVDPIYKISTSAKILIFGGKSRAEVIGFGAYYENPRPVSKVEADNFKQRLDELDKFSKIAVLGSEEIKTFKIENGACCGGEKGGNATTTPTLLHTTTNKPSLISQYQLFKGEVQADGSVSTSSSISSSKEESPKQKGLIGRILEIPKNIFNKLFKK